MATARKFHNSFLHKITTKNKYVLKLKKNINLVKVKSIDNAQGKGCPNNIIQLNTGIGKNSTSLCAPIR